VWLTRVTRRNNPEDTVLHSHRRENLKSYMLFISLNYGTKMLFIILKYGTKMLFIGINNGTKILFCFFPKSSFTLSLHYHSRFTSRPQQLINCSKYYGVSILIFLSLIIVHHRRELALAYSGTKKLRGT
jgi:hypothetical protein